MSQKDYFITPWFNANLKIEIGKMGEIIDAKTGKVIGKFKLKRRNQINRKGVGDDRKNRGAQ